ncbi:hypothetical protein AURDEDRAFT_116035 [Auricularia subglabra TFB-10046 SS5]|nr:hypothetical protein AURDEDRAFT_116035 [Auricularia subglabra TFB-10046 SS5]
MQQSRLASVLFALFAFSLFAYASPVATKEVARAADPLTVILNLLLDLKAKIDVHIAALVKLDIHADISVIVGQIVVLINVCVTAIVNVGVVLDLKDKDKIKAIAVVCAQIIISLQACITVFVNILVNITAVVKLDIAVQACLIQLNVCISGFLVILAPLCVSITAVVNLSLGLVITLLGLL